MKHLPLSATPEQCGPASGGALNRSDASQSSGHTINQGAGDPLGTPTSASGDARPASDPGAAIDFWYDLGTDLGWEPSR